ncbi:MAG: hypothetical protein H7Y27_08605, partial [Gemmatimonadaceae bacterium]|nr:hypothetical protein [Chitinophagaceae bacterium]
LLLSTLGAGAQTIQFTSKPDTTGVENVPYLSSLSAVIDNNDKLTFSAVTLPNWLTLSNSGAASGTQVNNSPIGAPGGVAGDANGNFYAVENYGGVIHKIAPDGTTTVFTTRNVNVGYCYGAIVVDNYLYVSIYNNGYGTGGIEKFDITQTNPAAIPVFTGDDVLSMTTKD